jgi:hypothetical protein
MTDEWDGCECDYCNHQGEPTCRMRKPKQVVAPAQPATNTGMAQGAIAQIAAEMEASVDGVCQEFLMPIQKQVREWARRLRHA